MAESLKARKVALYIRSSDGNMESVEAQLAHLESEAESTGGVVVKTYVDADGDHTAFETLMEEDSGDGHRI